MRVRYLVRTCIMGETRPPKEMQSDNVEHRKALTRTTQHQGPQRDQRKPEDSGHEHQARGVDEWSPKGGTLAPMTRSHNMNTTSPSWAGNA